MKIKTKLENLGYYTYYLEESQKELGVAKDLGGVSIIGGRNIEPFCIVILMSNYLLIRHGRTNIRVEDTFSSELSAITFVKKRFPLK